MSDLRLAVRKRYNYCCGYCGVGEVDAGSELEIDHFQPRSRGGSNRLDNLVYACAACNRNKAAYWPSAETALHRHLLHPLEDDITSHIHLSDTGQLEGLTPRGQFHIDWLHLNRPQLLLHRQNQLLQSDIRDAVAKLRASNHQLTQEVLLQREELARLNQRIRQLQSRL